MSAHVEIEVEPDRIPSRLVWWTIGGTIAVIIACAIAVWLYDAASLSGGGRSDVVAIPSRPPADPFESPSTPMELRRRLQQVQLHGWTWADIEHHRVRMPIDAAIERYLDQRGAR